MAGKVSYILVWGATPTDKTPLFSNAKSTEGKKPPVHGPPAGEFRIQLRDHLNNALTPNLKAVFSEDWETYGHEQQNAGLYEPLQVEAAELVLMILPSDRSLAVNTWELALALDSPEKDMPHTFFEKLVILLPAGVYHYISEVFRSGVEDPKFFDMKGKTGKPEPSLGVANSFAARWICLAVRRKYLGADSQALTRRSAILYYADEFSWGLGDSEAEATLQKVISVVREKLPLMLV